jgi:5'-3' exonuclease
MNILLIDSHNQLFRKVFTANKDKPLDETFSLFKELIIRDTFYSIKNFKPDRVVFAIDSKTNWRKKIFPDYKHKRSKARAKSTVDFEKFFPVAEAFYEDFKKTFSNFFFLKIDDCEGDDIIAVLTQKLNDKIITISTDGDMNQLLIHKNFRQYHPLRKEFVESLNPRKDLNIKILTGDRGDCIPGVKERFGIVKATKAMENLTEFLDENELNDAYQRNKSLIDLNLIPEEYKMKIMAQYNDYPISEYKSRAIFSFFTKHNIGTLFEELQDVVVYLKKIK